MTRSNHLAFSTRVWLLSVFAAPLLVTFGLNTSGVIRHDNFMEIVSFMIPIGFVCSIPNWIILILATWLINKTKITIGEKKVFLIFISLALTIALFMIVFGRAFKELWWIIPGYLITLIFGIVYYKLIPPSEDLQKKEISKVVVLEDILDDENY